MNRFRILLSTLALTLAACASVSSYDVPKTQAQLSQSLQKTESIVQKAQGDFSEKKALLENLKKGGSPAFKEIEGDLTARLKSMEKSLADITASRKEMVEANSDLASLGYGRSEVLAGTREYGLVEDSVKRFERAAGVTNSALLDYSRESNTIADLVSQKKLYYNFDVAEFQKRVQKNIQISNDNQKAMLKELNRAENVLNNWNKTEGRDQQEAAFNDMMATTKEYAAKAARFPELSKAVYNATMGSGRISTLDKEWPEVQKLVNEFDRLTGELISINDKFQNQVDLFRNPSKRVR
jgi:hypothetical protein